MDEQNPQDRRRLLKLAAAAASTLWLPRSAWSQPRMAADPFMLGVASGSPDDSSVVLWTRLVDGDGGALQQGPVTVRWEIASDDAFAQVIAKGQAQALPELAHSVHVEAQGLQPDRWYSYRFTAGAWTSRTGRTRTLPRPDADVQKLRIGYASCQRWEHGYFAAWRHMRQDAPDLVLFLGDYIYENPAPPNAVRDPGGLWLTSLDEYRRRHATYKTDPDLQAMHAACPWLVTWDDHEVQNDYAGVHPGSGGVSAQPLVRRAQAYQAYYEHMPLRASVLTKAMGGLASGADMRIYGNWRFGKLAQVTMLDTRQYRDAQACNRWGRTGSAHVDPASACEAWNDPQRTLLGAAQEQWLDAQLARNSATWTILGQSTLFGQRDNKPGPGQALWNDGWDGYAPARARVTGALAKHAVANPVLLGGDVHEHWVGHVKADYADARSAALGVEFCGTSITSRTRGVEQAAARLAENPHFVFADAASRGYGIADFTPGQLTVQLRGLDNVERADTGVRTLAQFRVAAGQRRLERA
jgi:alkaline phosphatase D